MLFSAKTKNVLGLALLGWGLSSYAEDLKLWQVGDKTPNFYQEPTSTSGTLSPLKPNQTMVVLQQQKDWVKLANLMNGDTGWVPQDQVKQTAIINLAFNKTPHSYQYQMSMRSEGDQPAGAWSIKGSLFENQTEPKTKSLKEKLGFKKKRVPQDKVHDTVEKEFEAMEKRFASIRARGFGFPIIQPVFVIAENRQPATGKSGAAATQPKQPIKEPTK